MKLITSLSRAAGLGLCVVAFSGTALADPGNGNGNGPEATPPGQEQKAETPAAAAPSQAPAPQSAQGQEQKAANAPAAKPAEAKPAKPAKPASAPGQAKKAEKQAEHKPAKASSESKGQSANAHHHVIICHRTGSESNPYVVLNIPWTAWTHGHSTHPAKNGNSDKVLKNPASRPGSKDGFTKADCGAPAAPGATNVTPPATQQTGNCPATVTTTEQVLIGIWHATGATKDGERKYVLISPSMKSAHWNKHEDDKPAYETRTVTRTFSGENCKEHVTTTTPPTTPSNQAPTVEQASQPVVQGQPAGTTPTVGAIGILPAAQETAAAPVGGVAGVVSPAPTAQNEPAGGVLGAIASAPEAIAATATGTLPFTGFPLWIVVLIAIAVLLAGVALRRRPTA